MSEKIWVRRATCQEALIAADNLGIKYPGTTFKVVVDDMGIKGFDFPFAVVEVMS